MDDHLREEVLQTETRYAGQKLSVRVDTVRLPDGNTGTHEVVTHPGAAAMVPLLDAQHVLLVRQWRHAAGRALLEIPAGTLHPGESPAACADRELMEEIGYRARTLTPLAAFYLAPGYSTELLHLFLAQDLTPDKRTEDADEFIEVVSLTWDEVETHLLRGAFADAKTVCGLLLARRLLKG